MKPLNILLLAAIVALTAACSPTRKLPPRTTLLKKQVLIIEPKSKSTELLGDDILEKIKPKPNKDILGFRYKLFFYNLAGPPKGKGLRYLLRNKMGEPPVLAQSVYMKSMRSLIANELENQGYFRPVVTSDSATRNKITTITYRAKVTARYRIRNVVYQNNGTAITKLIDSTKSKTALTQGSFYTLEGIKEERLRIDEVLKSNGYFYFNPDFIVAQVDSSHLNQVDIYIKVKQDTPDEATRAYTIDSITVYPTYSIRRDSLLHHSLGIVTDGINVVDPRHRYRPSIFSRAIQFRSGDLYTRNLHSRSLTRMVNLDAFQFVNLTFTKSDTDKLHATYYLTPAKRNSLSIGITTSTKSNNYFNTELKTTVKNRNLFRGAEIFELSASSGTNMQIGGNRSAYNSYTLASELSVTTPRMITPFHSINWYNSEASKTKMSIGYELLSKQPDYTIHSFKTTFGYIWKKHKKDQHELILANINLVRPVNLSGNIDSIEDANPTLKQSLEKQLILSTIYNFTYTNQYKTGKATQFYLNTSWEMAGNLADLLKSGWSKAEHQNTLLGVAYSQFIRATVDYRLYTKISKNATWANRVYLGFGLPYGNSKVLPYTKQFYSGGSTSLRGFKAYTIGPGSYHTSDLKLQTNQTGDMKLEFNSEVRTNIWSMVKGAAFVDVGNIWLIRNDIAKADAAFKLNQFYKQLGVSAGLGLRFDLSFLVLRFDLATPLRKPYLPEGQRWVFSKIDFGSKDWRKENLILNVAIGYPF